MSVEPVESDLKTIKFVGPNSLIGPTVLTWTSHEVAVHAPYYSTVWDVSGARQERLLNKIILRLAKESFLASFDSIQLIKNAIKEEEKGEIIEAVSDEFFI